MSQITVNFNAIMTVVEKPELNLDLSANPDITEIIGSSQVEASASSSPAVTKQYGDTRDTSSGTDNIDLTALPKGSLPVEDFTGLKVQFIKIRAFPTNVDVITFLPGVTDGYNFINTDGVAVGQIMLGPGEIYLANTNGNRDVVGPADKIVDAVSTDLNAKYDIQIAAG